MCVRLCSRYIQSLTEVHSTHGVTGITVTNSFLYTHWKASLIGHSDSNGAEDVAITVTMALNHWYR
jgi:pectate lyase